jgi:hypothetical protein
LPDELAKNHELGDQELVDVGSHNLEQISLKTSSDASLRFSSASAGSASPLRNRNTTLMATLTVRM